MTKDVDMNSSLIWKGINYDADKCLRTRLNDIVILEGSDTEAFEEY